MSEIKNIEEILTQPEFNALTKERKDQLIDLSAKLKGKGNMESVTIISEFVKHLPPGQELSQDEQEIMLEAYMESLPDKERQKFQLLINTVKKMKRT